MPHRLNPTQQNLLDQLLENQVTPKVMELLQAAVNNDSKLSITKSYTHFANYNLLVILRFLKAVTSRVGMMYIHLFKFGLARTYGESSQEPANTLLALYHLANNINEPLKDTYAEAICDSRFFTYISDKDKQDQIRQNLVIINDAVRSEIDKIIATTANKLSHVEPLIHRFLI